VKDNDPLNVAALALYRAKLGERAAATEAIERAVRLSPRDGEVLYVRAVVHALAGDGRTACADTADAIRNGKGAEEIRRSDELKSLKGCAAYDAVMSTK
jgi:hypothetical protein